MSDDLISFAEARRRLKLKPGRITNRRCEHPTVTVDERTMDVECEACEQRVEPAVILLRIARKELDLVYSQAQVAALRKEASDLNAEIRRLKAQARRARMKLQ